MAWRIDDLQEMLAPGRARDRGSDGDAVLSFLGHPIHVGGAFMHFTNFVQSAGIEQNALGQGRFAGIDMGGDTNVPNALEGVCMSASMSASMSMRECNSHDQFNQQEQSTKGVSSWRAHLQSKSEAQRRRQLAGFVLIAGLLASGMGLGSEVYRLASPDDDVIGTPFYVKADSRQTLLDIGRHYGLGFDEMQAANPNVDMWVPKDGADVLIPARKILPDAPRRGLVLNVAERRLYYYRSPSEIETFSVGIGREGWETPVGSYSVIEKKENPTWTPPASIRAKYAAEGKILPAVVPAGPDNPLGQFAMRLSNPSYLIHGTNKPWGVGMPVSSGCTRMFPEDIEHLFGQVAVGTPVTIVDQPFKVGWLEDRLFLEVNADEQQQRAETGVEQRLSAVAATSPDLQINWDLVRQVVKEKTGLPTLVGGRRESASWHHLDMIF